MNFKRFHESKNLAPTGWAQDFVTRIDNSNNANIITDDGRTVLRIGVGAGSGDYDNKYIFKINFEPNTQYTFSFYGKRPSTQDKHAVMCIQYTDDTVTDFTPENDGNYDYYTIVSAVNKTIKYLRAKYTIGSVLIDIATFMVNKGASALPYEPYGNTWLDSHYIKGTDTDTITTLPAVLYPIAETATVGLKGNTVQNGTPTPDNPIMPQGTGERTGNLFDKDTSLIQAGAQFLSNGSIELNSNYSIWSIGVGKLEAGQDYTLSLDSETTSTSVCRVVGYKDGEYVINIEAKQLVNMPLSFTMRSDCDEIRFSIRNNAPNIMLNSGSTPLPYEPYGIKIPISCGQQTETVYLGSVQSTRRVKKMVLTGQENWDSATTSYGKCFALTVNNVFPINSSFCTHFKNSGYEGNSRSTARSSLADGDFICIRTFDVIYCRMDSAGDTEGFKTYLQQQYAAGTPVCVWYVLASSITGIVNEPLMKIGSYADSISGISIPTTAGANTLDVQTTVKPSEVTASFNGWHRVAAAHERENGSWT